MTVEIKKTDETRRKTRVESHLFRRGGLPVKKIAATTWEEMRGDDVFGRAAQLAYYFFLALFPFLIFLIASLSVFGSADRGRAILFAMFARTLPGPAFHLIVDTFNDILRTGGPLKMSAGILFTLWSSSMGMMAVMDTLNAAYRVKETRSLLKQYAVATGLTIAMALLMMISLLAVVFGMRFARRMGASSVFVFVWKIAEWPAFVALALLGLAIAYYFAPDLKHRKWHWVTPGAVAGLALLVVISTGLRVYLHFVGVSKETYGPLGAVIVLLLTFYLAGIAVLTGGALNAVVESAILKEESGQGTIQTGASAGGKNQSQS